MEEMEDLVVALEDMRHHRPVQVGLRVFMVVMEDQTEATERAIAKIEIQ